MSYCTVMEARSGADYTEVVEYRNAWGFAPFIWAEVCGKYLGDEQAWFSRAEELWSLWEDARLPEHWRWTLFLTFDRVIVERDRLKECAGHLRQFVQDVGTRDRVCHLLKFADVMEGYEGDAIGLCFYGNSVSENLWSEWKYDEETDECIPYDIDKGDQHYLIGQTMDGVGIAG